MGSPYASGLLENPVLFGEQRESEEDDGERGAEEESGGWLPEGPVCEAREPGLWPAVLGSHWGAGRGAGSWKSWSGLRERWS